LLLFFLLTLGAGLEPAAPAPNAPPVGSRVTSDAVRLALRPRLATPEAAPRLTIAGRTFRASPFLACFYERRGFAPAWSTDGTLRPAAEELLAALAAAADDGLRTEDYRPAVLERLAAAARSRPDVLPLVDLDLLLSDAFLTFANDLRNGRVNPQALYPDCALEPEPTDLAVVLEQALTAGRVRATLAAMAPPHRGYALLRQALSRYRGLAQRGGAAPVPPGSKLLLGDRGERVAALRLRLAEAAAADAAPPLPSSATPELFDADLEQAVRAFQERRGLAADGAVGPATLAEINQEAEAHLRQLEVNLERWRWLPRDLGVRYVLVNIAGFSLEAVAEDRTALTMRVIVGKPYTRTPMFSSALDAVILNPFWNVPQKIALDELLPKAEKDPGYLEREGFERLPGSRLRQRPGPKNALGRIKFDFPNRFDVYLHDTPARTLFSRTVRSFSHGCIRIEKPLALAAWVLDDDPRWSSEAIAARIETGEELRVPVRRRIAVHVAYWTAWVDDQGTLTLGRDIYGRDAELARRLAAERP
ncbi:MAG TPA: L,D-transpeptidase family protein, partial [Thermoanaerobaculia bacterium]|nr:L,D-transpeptidase family protein [Thermoanaerobaculia bacterium]